MSQLIIDVSNNNPITAPELIRSKAVALICKATEGTSFHDETYIEHRAIARSCRKVFGSYLFLHPNSVGSEAEYYLAFADPIKGEIQPIIDAEDLSSGYRALAERVFSCREALRAKGFEPILYCGPYVWRNIVRYQPSLKTMYVWEAQYPSRIPRLRSYLFRLRVRLSGTKVVMWQFTDHYDVNGKHYDASYLLLRNIESILIK